MKTNKQIIAIILGMFLLAVVSATPIRLNESKFTLNAYAGETIQKEVVVYTNGDYAVFFKADNENITVTPNETIISKEEVVKLNITFNPSIPSGVYNFNIIASTEYEEVLVPVVQESSGGGGNYRYKVTYTPLNETNNTTNPVTYGGEPTEECGDSCGVNYDQIIVNKNNYIPIISVIGVILLLIALTWLIKRGKNGQNKNKRDSE